MKYALRLARIAASPLIAIALALVFWLAYVADVIDGGFD